MKRRMRMAGAKQPPKDTLVYSAGIMSQSFWFVEFKKYLKLLSEGLSPEEIKVSVTEKNLFGAPNEYRAKRIFGYLSNRADWIDREGIDLFFASDPATQKLLISFACFAGTDCFLNLSTRFTEKKSCSECKRLSCRMQIYSFAIRKFKAKRLPPGQTRPKDGYAPATSIF